MVDKPIGNHQNDQHLDELDRKNDQPAIVPGDIHEFRETRHQYFVRRARELGAYDKDADYDGQTGRDLEVISAVIEAQHHSGGSFVSMFVLFTQLTREWEGGRV